MNTLDGLNENRKNKQGGQGCEGCQLGRELGEAVVAQCQCAQLVHLVDAGGNSADAVASHVECLHVGQCKNGIRDLSEIVVSNVSVKQTTMN